MIVTTEPNGLTTPVGFTVLDGAALVAGAAVSSVHIRRLIRPDFAGPGWVILLGTFLWVGLTAAGPFIYIVRKHLRHEVGYPGVGDLLWTWLGLPWILTLVLQADIGAGRGRPHDLLQPVLGAGLALAALVSMFVVWRTWVMVSPDQASRTFAGPWTNRLGLLLAVAWPLQCGLGLVVLG
ncbi:MAG: hypothetical protein U0835_25605 [Isosphaeraceae bacterium]